MRKKQGRLQPHSQDRSNSDSTTLRVLECYSLSSRSLLFLYQCSSVFICGFPPITPPRRADSAAAIPEGVGREGAGGRAPRREFPPATTPRDAPVRATRSRAGDSRYENRVRRA